MFLARKQDLSTLTKEELSRRVNDVLGTDLDFCMYACMYALSAEEGVGFEA